MTLVLAIFSWLLMCCMVYMAWQLHRLHAQLSSIYRAVAKTLDDPPRAEEYFAEHRREWL